MTAMRHTQIQAIFFDAVGTLIHPDPPAAPTYWNIGRRHGTRYSIDEIGRRFTRAFAAEEEADRIDGWRTSEDRERRRWVRIVGSVLDDVNDPERCFQELYSHFSRPEAWRLEPEDSQVIQELQRSDYALGLASNYDRRLRTVLAGMPSLAALGMVVISSEVGWRKPAGEFFEAMCRQAALAPGQVAYIGDDPVNDFEGAKTAGLQAILLDRDGRHASFAGACIRRLAELIEKLDE
jgi:putative hydrolase of the HAD superfamily